MTRLVDDGPSSAPNARVHRADTQPAMRYDAVSGPEGGLGRTAKPVVQIRLLGPVEVTVDGTSAALPVRQTRAVLAALALRHPRPCSADELAEMIWPDGRPDRWQASLYAHVSRLRRVMTADVLCRAPAGYHLDVDPAAIDTVQMSAALATARDARARGDAVAAERSLAVALESWRGPALRELEDFEFADSAGRSLDRQRITAMDARVDVLVQLGRCAEAADAASARVELDRLDEAGWVRWGEVLVRSGHWHEAGRVVAEALVVLDTELGVGPGPELADLGRRVGREIGSASVRRAAAAEHADAGIEGAEPSAADAGRWLHGLDSVDHLLASLLAVGGSSSDPVVLGFAGGVDASRLHTFLLGARAAGVLDAGERALALTDEAAAMVTEQLGAGERALLYRRLADAAMASGSGVADAASLARWAFGAVPAGMPVADAVATGVAAIMSAVRDGSLVEASELAAALDATVTARRTPISAGRVPVSVWAATGPDGRS
jgi:SARP family transcriptional regulator, regulator of embCAB operon